VIEESWGNQDVQAEPKQRSDKSEYHRGSLVPETVKQGWKRWWESGTRVKEREQDELELEKARTERCSTSARHYSYDVRTDLYPYTLDPTSLRVQQRRSRRRLRRSQCRPPRYPPHLALKPPFAVRTTSDKRQSITGRMSKSSSLMLETSHESKEASQRTKRYFDGVWGRRK